MMVAARLYDCRRRPRNWWLGCVRAARRDAARPPQSLSSATAPLPPQKREVALVFTQNPHVKEELYAVVQVRVAGRWRRAPRERRHVWRGGASTIVGTTPARHRSRTGPTRVPTLPTPQATCDDVQDAAGRPRFVVRGEHAAYLEEDDGDEFFAGAGALSRFGTGPEESAEEIARKRDAANRGAGGGWLSWLKW